MILVNSKSCLKDFSRKHLVQEETVLLCLEGGFYDRASLSDGHRRYSNTWAGKGEHSVDSETFETKAIYSFLLTASALLSPWQDWASLTGNPCNFGSDLLLQQAYVQARALLYWTWLHLFCKPWTIKVKCNYIQGLEHGGRKLNNQMKEDSISVRIWF